MAEIDTDTVKHMAKLSRLELTEGELKDHTKQLGKILEYASHLPELQSDGEKPDKNLRIEEDVAQPYPNPESLLENAVAVENGFVKVPAILDKNSEERIADSE